MFINESQSGYYANQRYASGIDQDAKVWGPEGNSFHSGEENERAFWKRQGQPDHPLYVYDIHNNGTFTA